MKRLSKPSLVLIFLSALLTLESISAQENELIKLQEIPEKNQEVTIALNFIKKFKTISINGIYADQELINYVKNNRSIIGTMDKGLKNKIKKLGSSILSIHNDKIVLES